jgi:acyl-CoA synthetase (AMP-forming)/AMP-acid ligase II
VSRLSDVVISGGREHLSRRDRAGADAASVDPRRAVVGEPDPKWGQRVKAFVVVRAGERARCRSGAERIAPRTSPITRSRATWYSSSLPKNAGGKTIKSSLPLGRPGEGKCLTIRSRPRIKVSIEERIAVITLADPSGATP